MDTVLFWKDNQFDRKHLADFNEIFHLGLTISLVDCCLKNSFGFPSFIHWMEAFITFVQIAESNLYSDN